MKVLITADTVGGVWDYTCTLARAVREAGHEVLIAVVGDAPDERLARLAAGVEIIARPYRLEWMADAAADVRAAGEWLRRLATLWEADVVHLNQFAYAAERFPAPVLVVAHSDVLSWFGETLGREAPPEFAEYARWVRDGLAGADAVVAPTEYQSRLLARHYGRAADHVIHNGVDAPAGIVPARTGSAPLVVMAGRAWDQAKGARILDDALERLGPAAPAAHLLGSTRSPEGEEFAARRLVAHGRVDRAVVDAWLDRATLYAAPSLYEPFGLAPLEAALHGCALVLSDIGSFRELWDGCAEFFPAGDAGALAATLARLLESPQRCAALAAGARRRAERRYSAERMVARYLGLYHQLHAHALRASAPPHAPFGTR